MELPRVDLKANNLYQSPNLKRQRTEFKTAKKLEINFNV
jgi:hypothetical protein